MADDLSNEEIISKVVDILKEKGIFDQIRRDCLEDINTKSSFLNLNQRTEGYVKNFLKEQDWHTSLNKNQLRERLRKGINESGLIKSGVTHLVDQVINPINFENKIEQQIKELLNIKDEFDKEEKNFDDKLDDISEEDDEFFEKTSDDEKKNKKLISEIKKEIQEEENEKNVPKTEVRNFNLDVIKNEKYEESISSTDDLDCME